MLTQYKTVCQFAHQEIVIKKSRFIGYGSPVETEQAALAVIASIKKQHWHATHHCFAYIIGQQDEIQKAYDDGEPSGTAGKPMLEVMKHNQLKNMVVVVVRYFGGTQLGAGGLIRAYAAGALLAIEAAHVVVNVLHQTVYIEIDYIWLGKLEHELHRQEMKLGERKFTAQVTLTCFPLMSQAKLFIAQMKNFTQGQAVIYSGDAVYLQQC